MARKRPGLGKSLTDILAEEGRIDASRNLTQLIPQDDPDESEDETLPEFNIYGEPRRPAEAPRFTTPEGEPIQFDTYYVEDARPPKDNYGQGPTRSTRVKAHKFVPNERLTATAMIRTGQELLGTVYVQFQKAGKNYGDTYKYTNVPETIYDAFSRSTSKGRFINQYLNAYNPTPTKGGTRNDRLNTGDFY